MKANELRIGNLIMDKNYPERQCEILRLHAGCENSIAYKYNKTYEVCFKNPDCLVGITLTEEWLLKFGFEKAKQPNGAIFYGQRNKKFRFTENKQNEYYLFGYEYIVEIRYVHRLQNLYFALTGEELILK